jgi:hypothetical protein
MFFNLENKEEDTIYIFVDMDRKVLIPFRGTEEEMLDMWDILTKQGMKIDRAENVLIWTKDRNPFTPLL